MAITALSTESSNEVFDTVVVLLRDEDPSVRAAAAEALGSCGKRALERSASRRLLGFGYTLGGWPHFWENSGL